jgi:hypothetical protein
MSKRHRSTATKPTPAPVGTVLDKLIRARTPKEFAAFYAKNRIEILAARRQQQNKNL